MHCLNLYFECVWSGVLQLNSESRRCVWVGPDEIAAYRIAFNNDRGLLRYWGK